METTTIKENSIEDLYRKVYDRIASIDFLAGNGETLNIEEEVFAIMSEFGYNLTSQEKSELSKIFNFS